MRVVVAIAFVFAVTTAKADPVQDLAGTLRAMDGNGHYQGEWVALMPQVAEDCSYKLDKGSFMQWATRMSYGAFASADGIKRGVVQSQMKKDWESMMLEDKDAACGFADHLWGEDGDLMPGILRKRID